MGISGHSEKPKPFSSDCLVIENQKSIANAAVFFNFLGEINIKDQVFTICRFINAIALSFLKEFIVGFS